MLANFLKLNSKGLYQRSRKGKESCCLVFPPSTKHEIRHFNVVVVQRRLRNVQKKRDARAKLLFSLSKLIAFLPFALPSPSSLLELPKSEQIQGLIGILPKKKKTIAPWERYLVLSKALSLGIEKKFYFYLFIYYYCLLKFVMLLLCAFSCKVFDCTRQPLRVFFWHDFIAVRSKQQQINGFHFCQHAYFLLRYF